MLAAVLGVQTLLLVVLAVERAGIDLPLLRPILAVPLLAVAPGLLLLLLGGIEINSGPRTLLYAVGTSLLVEMAIGVGVSLLYPLVGIASPISETPIISTIYFVIFSLIVVVGTTRDRKRTVTDLSLWLPTASTLLSAALPFVGLIAITSLNRYETTAGAIGFLIVLSFVPLFVVRSDVDVRLYPLVIWTSALGLLYFKSFWDGSYPIEMWMHQMVLEQGRWVPILGGDITVLPEIRGMGQEGVLTDAVLYPIYALVAGIETIVQLEVVNPLFVALIPLAMYETFRQYVSERGAILCAFVFVFTFRFYSQHYPNAPRDVMATLFIVLVTLLLADSELDGGLRRTLAVVFVVGVTVSHYGTAYLSLAALGLSVAALVGLRLVRAALDESTEEWYDTLLRERPAVVDHLFLVFVAVFVLSWYLYTADGIKFQLFVGAIERLGTVTQPSGLASSRVLSSEPFSIDVTRGMVVVVLSLIGVGLLGEAVRTLLDEPTDVGDEHLVIAGSMTTVFALTFTGLGTGFGQGRILMLCLAVSSVFVVVGLRDVWAFVAVLVHSDTLRSVVHGTLLESATDEHFRSVLGVFLCVFLLVNTGVVAETVTGERDYGAASIVNNERLAQSDSPDLRLRSKGCIECDVQMRVWILRHGSVDSPVYDGGLSRSHYWYGHSLVVQLDDFVTEFLLTNRSTLYWEPVPTNQSRVPGGGYVVLTHDNYDTGSVVTSSSESRPLDETIDALGRSDRLYTSGSSTVYRVRNGSRSNWTQDTPRS
jgi:uncharacterized membrane protein